MLSHGMKQTGNISLHHLSGVILAVLNPWVAIGIVLLLAFFASYMNALSWADLTYVLPATSLGYVLLAFIAGGVGFVAGSPALTAHGQDELLSSQSNLSGSNFPPFAKGAKDGAPSVDVAQAVSRGNER